MSEWVNRPTVVIADDHKPIHEVVSRLIEAEFQVVLCVADGPSLVDAVRSLDIDVMIVDISMPGQDGIQAVREIVLAHGDKAPGAVFLTTYDDRALVERASEIGTIGYVLKDHAAEHLLPALRAVLGGDTYVCPGIAR